MSSRPLVATWEEIEPVLQQVDLLGEIESAFVADAEGRFVLPPVGEMLFDDPPGEMHLKYGHRRDGDVAVVKVASGFPGNERLGLSTSQGLMLLFDQRSGAPRAVLLDEGRLTDVRTAAAGAVVARALAPSSLSCIGVLGTGIQARRQLEWLKKVVDCRRVRAWGRTPAHLRAYVDELRAMGYEAEAAASPQRVAESSELLVTTTPSREPLLRGEWLRPGTHVSAVGSDSVGKQELDVSVLERAELVVVDRRSQCRERGELAAALAARVIREQDVVELGRLLADGGGRPADPDAITVADLTGVAVQDLAIARAVWRGLEG